MGMINSTTTGRRALLLVGVGEFGHDLGVYHRSERSRRVAALDAALVGATLALTLGGGLHLIPAVAGILVLLELGRVYDNRSSLACQSVGWYARVIAGPLLAFAAGLVIFADAAIPAALTSAGAVLATLVGTRWVLWRTLLHRRRRGNNLRPALVVGRGQMARDVADRLAATPGAGVDPVNTIAPDELDDELVDQLGRDGLAEVILVPEGNTDDLSVCVADLAPFRGHYSMLPPLAHTFVHPGRATHVAGLPLVGLGQLGADRATMPGKRAVDIIVAAAALVAAAPLMLLIAVAIKLDGGGPVLYRQRRVGHGGSTFQMLKFRSMVPGADRMVIDLRERNTRDGLLFKVHDDPRVTRVGRVIRRYSLDELPQLFNVLSGSMSLVGPRPLPVDPDNFGFLDGRRHSAPPGITGYWQVTKVDDLTYHEMVKLDLAYIRTWSLWLDVRLLLKTAPALAHRLRSPDC